MFSAEFSKKVWEAHEDNNKATSKGIRYFFMVMNTNVREIRNKQRLGT